jgi:hypothetical protein
VKRGEEKRREKKRRDENRGDERENKIINLIVAVLNSKFIGQQNFE